MSKQSDPVKQTPSQIERFLLIGVGASCVGLGVVGVLLPLLPTTPFLLVAAACFARSSKRLHSWLMNHRIFGPIIYEWREHRSMPRQGKIIALVMVFITFSLSTIFNFERPSLWIPLDIFGVGLFIYIWRLPSRPSS